MALTNAEKIQMTALALMRHSVFTTGGGGGGWPLFLTAPLSDTFETLTVNDYVSVSYSYSIT